MNDWWAVRGERLPAARAARTVRTVRDRPPRTAHWIFP